MVNEATETLAASPKSKISFLDVAQSHSSKLQSYYLISECDGLIFSGFYGSQEAFRKYALTLFVYFLPIAKSPPWGQALLMVVVCVCLAPVTLH